MKPEQQQFSQSHFRARPIKTSFNVALVAGLFKVIREARKIRDEGIMWIE